MVSLYSALGLFGFGGQELLVIAFIGLLLFGPVAVKRAVGMVREARKAVADMNRDADPGEGYGRRETE